MIYILIGSIGSGKTTTARQLATKLNYEFVELDEVALAKTGYKTVAQAISKNPTKLKEAELESSKELSTKDNLVVVLGGESIFNRLNFDYFNVNSNKKCIVYLEVDLKTQLERILSKHSKLESEKDKIVENLKKMNLERDFLSNQICDIKISTSSLNTDSIVEKIIKVSLT
jgi:shikimate kinase